MTHRRVDPPASAHPDTPPICTPPKLAWLGASFLPQRERGREDHPSTHQLRGLRGLGGGSPGQPACEDSIHPSLGSRGQGGSQGTQWGGENGVERRADPEAHSFSLTVSLPRGSPSRSGEVELITTHSTSAQLSLHS